MAADQHDHDHETIRKTLMVDSRAASQRLLDTIDSASVTDCMAKRDDAGWNSRDHLAHVTAWKRAAIYPLRGKSCAEGMGVTPEQAGLPWDDLNDVIRAQTLEQPMEQAVKAAIDCQKELEQALQWADLDMLDRTNGEVIPELTGLDPDEPFVESLRFSIVEHLDMHCGYIGKILTS